MNNFAKWRPVGALIVLTLISSGGLAQQVPEMSVCNADPKPPFCKAVRGDRAEGWLAQSRSEVMAQHGMVVTS